MRFAIAANDRYLGVFESFLRAGWQPVKLFTVPARSEFANNQMAIAFAEQHNAGIQISRMSDEDMRDLQERGCEALVVASYDWIIGDWTPYLKYGVNFHSSPLPDGRGPYPPVRAILEQRKSWGVTCHKLTPQVDHGDILAIEEFALEPDEFHERLDLKIQMASRRLAARVAHQFKQLWDGARPQEGGSYWPKFTLAERVIDFKKPVEEVLRHIRAYGTVESVAYVGQAWLIVKRATGWAEKHGYAPGSVVHLFNRTIVVAVTGGYVAILDSELAPPHVLPELQALGLSPPHS